MQTPVAETAALMIERGVVIQVELKGGHTQATLCGGHPGQIASSSNPLLFDACPICSAFKQVSYSNLYFH